MNLNMSSVKWRHFVSTSLCICICICIWWAVFVFVFVFDQIFPGVFVFVFVFWNFGKKMYLYLIKRIWPQPWTHWGITTLQMNSSVFKPHEWAPFQSNYNFTLTHDQYKVECLYNAVTFVKILHSQRCQNAIFKMLNDFETQGKKAGHMWNGK